MGWNDFLVPKCKINPEDDTITCDASQIVKGKTIVGTGLFTVDMNSGVIIDDGGLPEPTQRRLITYLKHARKIKI